MKQVVFLFLFFVSMSAAAQDSTTYRFKGVYFPAPNERKSKVSIGFTNTTMPYDVTEELHFRVPALDIRWIKKLSQKLSLDVHGSLQGFQNLGTIGPRWSTNLSDRYSIAIGNDFGFWFGIVNTEGIKTKGHGFQNIPNISIGRRFNRRVLLTFRADAQMNYGIKTFAKNTPLTTEHRFVSGSSYALILEQPFYGRKFLSLGFRAIYTDFFWQTWTLFETFDRNIFYPQVIVCLNL